MGSGWGRGFAQATDRCTTQDSKAPEFFLGDGRGWGAQEFGQGGGARLETFGPESRSCLRLGLAVDVDVDVDVESALEPTDWTHLGLNWMHLLLNKTLAFKALGRNHIASTPCEAMAMPVKLPTPVLCTIASEATDGVGRFMAGPCGQV